MVEPTDDLHPLWLDSRVEVIGQRLNDDFVEGADFSPLAQPQFQRLRLHDELIGRVFKLKSTKVGLASHGAQARELGAVESMNRFAACLPRDRV